MKDLNPKDAAHHLMKEDTVFTLACLQEGVEHVCTRKYIVLSHQEAKSQETLTGSGTEPNGYKWTLLPSGNDMRKSSIQKKTKSESTNDIGYPKKLLAL